MTVSVIDSKNKDNIAAVEARNLDLIVEVDRLQHQRDNEWAAIHEANEETIRYFINQVSDLDTEVRVAETNVKNFYNNNAIKPMDVIMYDQVCTAMCVRPCTPER
jgi:hypothetical protein